MTSPGDSSAEDGWARLGAALDRRGDDMTAAERAIAAYLRDNCAMIPYETGATIAAAAGVSEMSVIRFIRSLGFGNLRSLKDALRPRTEANARAIDDVMARFRPQSDDHLHLRRSLELELDAIARAYDQAMTPRWHRIVSRLVHADRIHVAGFQASQGLAMDFATRLKWVRPGVRFAEARAGVYSEVLESDPAQSCLVLVDTASYARKSILLARKAQERRLPTTIVCDRYSNWPFEFTEDVLVGYTQVGTFWDSLASLTAVLNLLVNSIAAQLGDRAVERFRLLAEWGEHFAEFDGATSQNARLHSEAGPTPEPSSAAAQEK